MTTTTFDRVMIFAHTSQQADAWIHETVWTPRVLSVHIPWISLSEVFRIVQRPNDLRGLDPQRTALIFLEGWPSGIGRERLDECLDLLASGRFLHRFTGDWQPYDPYGAVSPESASSRIYWREHAALGLSLDQLTISQEYGRHSRPAPPIGTDVGPDLDLTCCQRTFPRFSGTDPETCFMAHRRQVHSKNRHPRRGFT